MKIFHPLKSLISASLKIIGFIYLTFFSFNLIKDITSKEAEDFNFETSRLTRKDLSLNLSATGTLSALGTVEVGTQVSGTISEVFADYNDTVKTGQILAILDTALLEADLKETQALETRAKALLKQAEAELIRHKSLYEKGYFSEQEYLLLLTEKEKAEADLLSAQARKIRAETNMRHAVIRSPIDGKVIEKSVEAGQTVAASMNTPTLFILAEDLAEMKILAKVDETDIGQIFLDQKINFSVEAWPKENFPAKVVRIRLNPEVISNVVSYTVEAEATNPELKLLPGMTATLDFEIETIRDKIVIADTALRFTPEKVKRSEKAGIWKLREDGPYFVEVKSLLSDGLFTAIEDCDELKEGDTIITANKKKSEQDAKQPLLSRLFSSPGRRPRH